MSAMNCCLLENNHKFKVNLNLGDNILFSTVLLVCCEYQLHYQYVEILFFLIFTYILKVNQPSSLSLLRAVEYQIARVCL